MKVSGSRFEELKSKGLCSFLTYELSVKGKYIPRTTYELTLIIINRNLPQGDEPC